MDRRVKGLHHHQLGQDQDGLGDEDGRAGEGDLFPVLFEIPGHVKFPPFFQARFRPAPGSADRRQMTDSYIVPA